MTSALSGVTSQDGLAGCYVNARSFNRFPSLLRCLWSVVEERFTSCPVNENGLFFWDFDAAYNVP
jgi:hypothetical protein